MLNTENQAEADDAWFADWRSRELERLVRADLTYLDYTGTALYPASLVRADADRLLASVLGNPHSEHGPSRAATEGIGAARHAVLSFVHASPDEYDVVFTANTSGACHLVAESFPFRAGSTLLLSADNHNSVNGIREYARASGATIGTLAVDAELRLVDPCLLLDDRAVAAPSLFAFPAQSNFSGVRHPLSLVTEAQRHGWHVLLDAAAFLPTSDLDLQHIKPDFVTLSLYKIAGYPTGVGALIARKDAMAELRRPWFSGGTVKWASVQHQRHLLTDGPEGFEDGTPSFLAAAAVAPALAAMQGIDRPRLGRHLCSLTRALISGIESLTHRNGRAVVGIHGPSTVYDRGATIAISVYDEAGRPIPYWEVESAARDAGIAVRGGCFCNPGCAEAAFRFPPDKTGACLQSLGPDFSIPRFARCLGDQTVGAIRVSMGLGTIRRDVERFLDFLTTHCQ